MKKLCRYAYVPAPKPTPFSEGIIKLLAPDAKPWEPASYKDKDKGNARDLTHPSSKPLKPSDVWSEKNNRL
jgi:hypothetical protein